jgi:hypothetical protein
MVKHRAIGVRGSRNWSALFVALLLVFVPTAGGLGFALAVGGGATNGQFMATPGSGIDHTVSAAFGWDPHLGQYVTGSLALGTNNVTISFPTGDSITSVWVMTNNDTWDAHQLLVNSTVYLNANVKMATTADTNLSGVTMYMGTLVNSSAMSSVSDKGITDFLVQVPVYSSTVNQLNKVVELPILQLLGSVPTSTAAFYMALSPANNFKNTSQVSFVITQTFGHTAQYNIFAGTAAFAAVLALIEIVLLYLAVPRHKEWEQ